ncbi:MAG: glycosyltransferase [Clostridia bacterium]|nr:glycosyltransferase [Clostridia bacterium]
MSFEYDISVIIPAHNEEKYVKRCIESVKQADEIFDGAVEIIVVCNRCTDDTARIAQECGARTVFNEDRCIARVRNEGIKAAKGEIIVTIDCDNRMTPGTLVEIYSKIRSGKYIGGGTPMRFERTSFPLKLNDYMCRAGFRATGLYAGIIWAEKSTFDAIGGFVDKRSMEDIATAKLIKQYGKRQGRKFGVLRYNRLINSTRKYDDAGDDWLYFKLAFRNLLPMLKAARGDTKEYDALLDEMFYDYNDNHK